MRTAVLTVEQGPACMTTARMMVYNTGSDSWSTSVTNKSSHTSHLTHRQHIKHHNEGVPGHSIFGVHSQLQTRQSWRTPWQSRSSPWSTSWRPRSSTSRRIWSVAPVSPVHHTAHALHSAPVHHSVHTVQPVSGDTSQWQLTPPY